MPFCPARGVGSYASRQVSIDPSTHPKLHLMLQQTTGFDCVDDESKPEDARARPDAQRLCTREFVHVHMHRPEDSRNARTRKRTHVRTVSVPDTKREHGHAHGHKGRHALSLSNSHANADAHVPGHMNEDMHALACIHAPVQLHLHNRGA
eukprot:5097477-Pleurochrysis_carterae.AAC.3